ncbi:MAG TPA: AGE family epimerase/isomerase, partial [Bacillota bacterium]|nr:AGE family epimerase/isomerase [Bacillota bacterium]
MKTDQLYLLRTQLDQELRDNILSFWINYTQDQENGGFYGFISDSLEVDSKYPKSCVLTARILWTFATAYRTYREKRYLALATRAYHYLLQHFWDQEYSGVYWMVDFQGKVLYDKKQSYAQAFAIYGLTEYYLATGNSESLTKAQTLFEALENYFYDSEHSGYCEALSRDWKPITDMALGAGEPNVSKTMNSHLHILEAYTNLNRVWENQRLKIRLRELIQIMLDFVTDPQTNRFHLFFDAAWHPQSTLISFGHDIEGSWLLLEAAEVLNDAQLLIRVKDVSLKMAEQVLKTGYDHKHGGIFDEGVPDKISKRDKDWWPQAEAVVGFYNAFQLSGKTSFGEAALQTWNFINRYLSDKEHGEWLWKVSESGINLGKNEKVGPWKCPYHNSRMCLEL